MCILCTISYFSVYNFVIKECTAKSYATELHSIKILPLWTFFLDACSNFYTYSLTWFLSSQVKHFWKKLPKNWKDLTSLNIDTHKIEANLDKQVSAKSYRESKLNNPSSIGTKIIHRFCIILMTLFEVCLSIEIFIRDVNLILVSSVYISA